MGTLEDDMMLLLQMMVLVAGDKSLVEDDMIVMDSDVAHAAEMIHYVDLFEDVHVRLDEFDMPMGVIDRCLQSFDRFGTISRSFFTKQSHAFCTKTLVIGWAYKIRYIS